MAHLIELAVTELTNSAKNNKLSIVFNSFDEASINSFNQECYALLGIEPNK
jgi:hypothetical protein